MSSPLDLQRLAVRVEALQRTGTHDWDPADEHEFRARLPEGRDPRHLPAPETLRSMANHVETPSTSDWQKWISTARHLEDLAHANDPRNPRRAFRDMVRGRLPRL